MIKINNVEILTIGDNFQWNGKKDLVARTLDFNVLYVPQDNNFPVYRFKVGDKVEWTENDKILFLGYIQKIDFSTDGNNLSVSCIDLMIRLLKSKCIGRFKGTFNDLCNKICGLFGLINDIKIDNKQVHNIISEGDKSYYDILDIALNSMYSRYTLYLEGTSLKLCDVDIMAAFETGKNIKQSEFSQDMSDIVTKVLIVDNEGNLLDSVQDDKALKEFGLFQEVYNYSKDCSNNIAEARKLLTTVNNEATIIVPNNNRCISGKLILIDEPLSNLNGVFEILSDSHTVGSEDTMQLNVKYLYGMKNKKAIEVPEQVEKPLDTPYQNKELTFEQSVFISNAMDASHKYALKEVQSHADLFANQKEAQRAYWKEYDEHLNKILTREGFKKEGYKWVYNG